MGSTQVINSELAHVDSLIHVHKYRYIDYTCHLIARIAILFSVLGCSCLKFEQRAHLLHVFMSTFMSEVATHSSTFVRTEMCDRFLAYVFSLLKVILALFFTFFFSFSSSSLSPPLSIFQTVISKLSTSSAAARLRYSCVAMGVILTHVRPRM
jgi:hypothetical protein